MVLTQIIDLLSEDNHYNVSYSVEIAKGRYELPKSFTQIKEKVIRKYKFKG